MKSQNNKDIEITLVHEFWSSRKEFFAFIYFSSIYISTQSDKEIQLLAFSSYGNFLRHLYSFYEGIIINRNKNLLKGNEESEGERISKILNEEVEKLIRNKILVLEQEQKENLIELTNLKNTIVPLEFGKHFRQIRNRFSHINSKRVSKCEITLDDFYNLYHKFVLLLYESPLFSWNIKSIENYNWAEIEKFMKKTLVSRHA
jgi:hypothetical protein